MLKVPFHCLISPSFLVHTRELSNSISQLCHVSAMTAGWLYIRWIAGVILALIDDDISPFEEFPILWMIERGCLSGINRQGINHRPPIHQITQTSAITRHTNKTRASQSDYYNWLWSWSLTRHNGICWTLVDHADHMAPWLISNLILELFTTWMSRPQ